ncbi:MAG: NAD(P)/FAD-dependent oxidoreductase [Syntrophaceae bacterium]|nr:NAD(P)/FAD-dependent oxidoreductase [Syntrophaceae bacterium]
MSDSWDVIIVGAGVGGLTAATLLVKAGLRVLILDRNSHPGGTAYVYQRKGFTFPMGPLGFSTPTLVKEILHELDGEDFQLSRIQYRLKAFNIDLPLSLPFPKMIEELSGLFPKEEGAIRNFFWKMKEIISEMNSPGIDPNRSVLEKAMNKSALEYLSELVRDWRLRRILGSIGTQEPYSSLPLLASMWNLISNEGIWYPMGGMRSLCDRFVKGVKTHQGDGRGFGEIKLLTEIEAICIKEGKVIGVALQNGEKIYSSAVISNADYKNTFLKLIDAKTISEKWYRAVAMAKQTGSNLQVCLGVNSKKLDFSFFKEAERVIYRRIQVDSSERTDWSEEEIDPKALSGQELEVSLLSKNDRMLGPEGTEVIVIRTEAEHPHFKKFRPEWRRRVPEYQDFKIQLGKAMVQEVETILPGLEKAILVMDVATPLTFEEQGGRSGGAVAGWSWNYEDASDYQPRDLVRTPIQGLYMAGYQAFSSLFMGGIPTAVESGKRAAQAVLQGAGPTKEILVPISKKSSPF